MKIVKRDGRCEFDQSKIKNAVLKSFVAVDGELTDYAITKAENIAAHIESLQKEERLTVEQIQDLVEHGLMSTRRKDVAKAYITYRHERTKEREKRGNTFNIIENRMNAKNIENSMQIWMSFLLVVVLVRLVKIFLNNMLLIIV